MNLREQLCFPDNMTVTVTVRDLRAIYKQLDDLHLAAEEHVRNCEMYGPLSDPSKGSFKRLQAATTKVR